MFCMLSVKTDINLKEKILIFLLLFLRQKIIKYEIFLTKGCFEPVDSDIP